MAGGLGVRVTHLSQTLAKEGFTTHLFFIGDPHLKGEETGWGGKLVLHRWCQWISQYYPSGVYQGENEKIFDFNESIPPFVLNNIIKPASRDDKIVVILAEEWHTAEAVCRLSSLLQKSGLRDKVIIFWNANNIFGFEKINWDQLSRAATITTVSRYMKHVMWRLGLNPIVIPNGIPRDLLNKVNPVQSAQIRKYAGAELLLAKIARWDPDKCWNMAVEATSRLKARGIKTVLLARGGMEPYGEEVVRYARRLGLRIEEARTGGHRLENYFEAIAHKDAADLVNITFYCPQELLRVIYHASDAVLANSGREPFGLVGLETMAAGGIAFTGNTGEDYALSFYNSIVLETGDSEEIEDYLVYLNGHAEESERIRKNARSTALAFVWEQILERLIRQMEHQARIQGTLSQTINATAPEIIYKGAMV
jgi:glycosyltransferase involved in cell wall biosynthesis